MKQIVLKGDCPYFESNCGGCATDKIDCRCPKLIAYEGVNDPQIKQSVLDKLNVTATSKFGIMLQMQSVFAQKFHKIKDLSKEEIDKWTNEYLVCIEDELSEASEFLSLYKIKKYNEIEYRKELIDIIHFLMDGMLVAGITEQDLITVANCEGNDLLDYLVNKSRLNARNLLDKANNDLDLARLYSLDFIRTISIRNVRQQISWKHWKSRKPTIDKEAIIKAWFDMLVCLIDAFVLVNTTSDDIFNIYVNKNVENQLRQDNGYNK